jgi:hypothetical protein
VDLNSYFNSYLSIHKLSHPKFPKTHRDHTPLILGTTLDSPFEILEAYDFLIGQNLKKSSNRQMSIDYYLINLPETLTHKPQRLMRALAKSEDVSLFENLTIQTIITFKWNKYTRGYLKL